MKIILFIFPHFMFFYISFLSIEFIVCTTIALKAKIISSSSPGVGVGEKQVTMYKG